MKDFLREKLSKGEGKLVGPGAAMHEEQAKPETPPAKVKRATPAPS